MVGAASILAEPCQAPIAQGGGVVRRDETARQGDRRKIGIKDTSGKWCKRG